MPKYTLTRRALVASTAAIPAAAALPIAVHAATVASPADDHLVALANEVFRLWNSDAADEVIDPDNRMLSACQTMKNTRAQSVRGLAAKARVADLVHRINGEVIGEGPHDAWMVVDDLLAMTGTDVQGTTRATVALDPIFAAINQHRQAAIRRMRASRITCHMECGDPANEAAEVAENQALDIEIAAERALADTRPTTFAGVIALLAYVDELYIGTIALPEDEKNWHINAESLSEWGDGQIVDRHNGEPVELPLAFWVMRNVRAALRVIASGTSAVVS